MNYEFFKQFLSTHKNILIIEVIMGFCEVLGLIFIILKLLGVTAVATWSWWWVTSPLWIGFIIDILVYAIAYNKTRKW